MRFRGLWTVLALVAASAGIPAQKPQTPSPYATSARPVVELLKGRYALGEPVWFWVGVERDVDDRRPIAPSLISFRLIVTPPDGVERVEQVGPDCGFCGVIDNPGDTGWTRNYFLIGGTAQLGRWQIATESAGRRSKPQSFVVEEVPLLKDIRAELMFASPVVVGSTATLVVRNQSSEVVRFPLPGQHGTSVNVRLDRAGGGSAFVSVPPTWLPKHVDPQGYISIHVGGLTWGYARDNSVMATVPPKGTYELTLPIAQAIVDSNRPIAPGEYTVTLSTQLDIFPGEPNGPWKDIAPIRISVSAATKAIWR